MQKLHKLVFVHYNLRLRVRNLLYKQQDEDYYNPIDLNHIFEDDDILDDWIRETEQPVLDNDLTWLDEGIRNSDEGRRGRDEDEEEEEQEDDTLISSRSKQFLINKKGKGIAQSSRPIFPSSSSSSDDDDDGTERGGGGDYGGNGGEGGGG